MSSQNPFMEMWPRVQCDRFINTVGLSNPRLLGNAWTQKRATLLIFPTDNIPCNLSVGESMYCANPRKVHQSELAFCSEFTLLYGVIKIDQSPISRQWIDIWLTCLGILYNCWCCCSCYSCCCCWILRAWPEKPNQKQPLTITTLGRTCTSTRLNSLHFVSHW